MNNEFKFYGSNKVVGSKFEPYIIAEIGINFNGSYDLAIKTIDAAVKCGVNAVKFQSFDTDEFMSNSDLIYSYSDVSGKKQTSMYEMFKKYELPENWHFKLFKHAQKNNVDFISSSADKKSIDLLCTLKVPFLKFSSEDLINLPLLEYGSKKKYPTVLSTGMANEKEIEQAVDFFKKSNSPYMLLHCVSLYPTTNEHANISRILSLREKFNVPVGYSDHTKGITAAILATAYGSSLIEKHFTLDHSLEGPDHIFSANPIEMMELVKSVKNSYKQIGKGSLAYQKCEDVSRSEFRRSIVANRNIMKGEVLNENMLCLKRPGTGLHPQKIQQILGMLVNRKIKKNQQIKLDMLLDEK